MFFRKTRMEDQTNPIEQAPQEENPEVTTPEETSVEENNEVTPVEPGTQGQSVSEEVEVSEETPIEEPVKNPELNCPSCKGEGLNADQTDRCTNCGGTGRV